MTMAKRVIKVFWVININKEMSVNSYFDLHAL